MDNVSADRSGRTAPPVRAASSRRPTNVPQHDSLRLVVGVSSPAFPGCFCFLTLHPPDALGLRLTEPLLAGLLPGALKTWKPEAEALLSTWRAVLVLLCLPGLSLGVEGPSLRSRSPRQWARGLGALGKTQGPGGLEKLGPVGPVWARGAVFLTSSQRRSMRLVPGPHLE